MGTHAKPYWVEFTIFDPCCKCHSQASPPEECSTLVGQVLEPELGVTASFDGLETSVGNSLLCRSR